MYYLIAGILVWSIVHFIPSLAPGPHIFRANQESAQVSTVRRQPVACLPLQRGR